MELKFKDTNEEFSVSKAIFDCDFNNTLVHQIITAYLAAARQGTHSQKNRSEVVGSNKKPWKQKGTGRARAGSTKSPIWRSGGVTFAAKPKNYTKKINRKMYKGALRSILSKLLREKRLLFFENFFLEKPKTKLLIKKLKKIKLKYVLIINHEIEKNLFLASRNLYKVDIRTIKNIDPVSLLSFENTIIIKSTIKLIENLLT